MATQTTVQQAVLSLEQGRLGFIIRIGALATLVIALVLLYLFVQFRGLADPSAMDQAQIARNLASGKGFTTDIVTPRALAVMKEAGKIPKDGSPVDISALPDIYQSPLVPWLHSIPLSFIRSSWKMSPTDLVYAGDRLLAFVSMVFLLLSLVVWYFVFARLFDSKLALLSCAAVLVTDLVWQFSMSALPQMVLLLLFGVASLLTVLAEEEQAKGNFIKTVLFIAAAGLAFGLMILAHGLAAWIFFGWLIFAGIAFYPRGLVVFAGLGAGLLVVAPWLVRNYLECGNPFGIAASGMLDSSTPYTGFLRLAEHENTMSVRAALRIGIINQLGSLSAYLGLNFAAAMFFGAILHRFRNEAASLFRWALLAMWVGAVVGMCFFRPSGDVSANQLHVLFLPGFICFGLAFLLVLWGRWDYPQPLLRTLFLSLVLFLCSVPMIMRLLGGPEGRVQWPPYIPPFIAVLGDWFDEEEMIGSDMPWAVAWYAQRHSLLLPQTVREFSQMHDYREFKQQLQGLYLTPISGNQPLFSNIYKGRFSEWAPLITRPPQTLGFPFSAFTALPVEGECILFADRERWNRPRPVEE
ncbi:MAG: hypothetical protein Fur0032_16320 [Terrimicrobiaceae bacterium]